MTVSSKIVLVFITVLSITSFFSIISSLEDNVLKLSSESTQSVLMEEHSLLRKKGLIAIARTTFGDNPYFWNSFAVIGLDYLPPLPLEYKLFTPILSFHYLIADKELQAFSTGGGIRHYCLPLQSVLGYNIFYDFKSIPFDNFYQIGLGLEFLRVLNCISLLEVRANLYLPLNKRFKRKTKYHYPPDAFIAIGTNVIYNPGGLEIQLGKRIFYKNIFDLYFSIAPYCLFGQGYGIEYNGVFRWKSIAYAGIQLYQNIYCQTMDIAGTIGISIPLDSETICEKFIPTRIPNSRWETIKLRECPYWKTNY